MAITTYDELVAAIPKWAERKDISSDQIKEFISMAEADTSHMLRVPAMEFNTLLPVSNKSIIIPPDMLELRALTWQGQFQTRLQYLPWDEFVAADANQNTTNVMYYSRQGNIWFLTGDPGDGATILCNYFGYIDALSTSNQQNWLIGMSPMVYLFGGLKYLYEFTMEQERAAYWGAKFIGEINKLQAIADNAEYRGSAIAIRQYPTGV